MIPPGQRAKEKLYLIAHLLRDTLKTGKLPEGFGEPWREKLDEIAADFTKHENAATIPLWSIIREAIGEKQ